MKSEDKTNFTNATKYDRLFLNLFCLNCLPDSYLQVEWKTTENIDLKSQRLFYMLIYSIMYADVFSPKQNRTTIWS